MASVWNIIGGWLRGGEPKKDKAKAAKGKPGTQRPGAQKPGGKKPAAQTPGAAKAVGKPGAGKAAAGPQSPAEAQAQRQRLIEEAMRIRAEKMEGFKDMDPETRARIERAALGKLNPKKSDKPENT